MVPILLGARALSNTMNAAATKFSNGETVFYPCHPSCIILYQARNEDASFRLIYVQRCPDASEVVKGSR